MTIKGNETQSQGCQAHSHAHFPLSKKGTQLRLSEDNALCSSLLCFDIVDNSGGFVFFQLHSVDLIFKNPFSMKIKQQKHFRHLWR